MSITTEMPHALEDQQIESTVDVEIENEVEDEQSSETAGEPATEQAAEDSAPAGGFHPETVAYHDFQKALSDATGRLAAAVLERLKAEAAHKLAKAEEKAAGETLQKIVSRGVENYPLFDVESKAEESTEADDQSSEEAESTDDSEAWRAVEIGEINVPESILNKLIEAGIETVGDLADWSGSGKKLTDINGIGAAKAEKIEAAMDEFWAERQETKGC